ncbi:hypothetical protein [Caenibius sp. WL]|uniref:hypothetical protein n=1 Tax=Caenibius sp. WL TaxID=2872646 RepID=UPI001C99E224|nr:hypothetical protein [Caenibius sp. WL]QZP08989.1 hypothetical protein K5X80_04195 [Caenibius sp. WL]
MTELMPLHFSRSDGRLFRKAVWLGVALAIALSVLSFGNAAAGVGFPVQSFASFGPAFFAWKPGYRSADEEWGATDGDPSRRASLLETGRNILAQEPLSIQSLRLAAWSEAQQGDIATARLRMKMAERLTRRDVAVQLWLIDDAVRSGDLGAALRGYDVVLRTAGRLHAPLLQRLVASLSAEEARSALRPYAVADNPWFPQLLRLASQNGSGAQAALLLSSLSKLPDTTAYRTAYTALVPALMKERQFDLLRRIYPRLPGALESEKYKGDPALRGALGTDGYPPLAWVLAANADRNTSIVTGRNGPVLQIEAKPFTNGPVATRTLLPKTSPLGFGWTVKRQGVPTGTARWSIRCLDSGLSVRSPDLLAGSGGKGVLTLPQPCRVVELTLTVNGGTGSTGPAFDLMDLHWLNAEPASARD